MRTHARTRTTTTVTTTTNTTITTTTTTTTTNTTTNVPSTKHQPISWSTCGFPPSNLITPDFARIANLGTPIPSYRATQAHSQCTLHSAHKHMSLTQSTIDMNRSSVVSPHMWPLLLLSSAVNQISPTRVDFWNSPLGHLRFWYSN
ncbi:uncharacterized protein Bfra_009840 [Botrytis fragariae]|uniref:Uncharacterized protein n=1 Tax=Botrytis fragariae TaxID=1964551 RepID=A0A8H6EFP9_9HELO|nr:uncharacterized protein Bfra_009840 [Botrytis fragariae]KAF5870453.1 hypothetical protein Bfra_009840 [Botrytis fragariae]